MRRLVAMLVLLATPVFAQPPLTIAWTQPDAGPIEAQGFVYRFYLDTQPGVILQGVTCTWMNATVECQAPFPAPAPGVHEVYLTGENSAGEGGKSPTLTFRYPITAPQPPTGLRIIRGA